MPADYLSEPYVVDGAFDLPRLINDDFLVPIKLLFNHGHYVSSAKLLVIFIDTLAFLESGQSSGSTFRLWLDRHCDLGRLGVTAEEVWEWRNGLLHMSNLDSRKVKANKVRRLLAFAGKLPSAAPMDCADGHFLDLFQLVQVVAEGIEKQIEAMSRDRNGLVSFLERYDLVISDARALRLDVG